MTTVFLMERTRWDNLYTFEDFLGDGIIVLHDIIRDLDRKRGISVIKMRGSEIDRKTRPYNISKQGIKVFHSEEII